MVMCDSFMLTNAKISLGVVNGNKSNLNIMSPIQYRAHFYQKLIINLFKLLCSVYTKQIYL